MSVLKKLIPALPVVVAVLAATAASAQETRHLDVTTVVHKEVVVEMPDGRTETKLVDADSVVPGERVIYTITFANVGDEPAENVVITNPIAESLVYVAGSASGDGMRVEFSIDGGSTFAPASELKVIDEGIERPATTSDYTHVRWVMQTELAAGGEGQASFAAVLQ